MLHMKSKSEREQAQTGTTMRGFGADAPDLTPVAHSIHETQIGRGAAGHVCQPHGGYPDAMIRPIKFGTPSLALTGNDGEPTRRTSQSGVLTEETTDTILAVDRHVKPLCHRNPCNDSACRLDHIEECQHCGIRLSTLSMEEHDCE